MLNLSESSVYIPQAERRADSWVGSWIDKSELEASDELSSERKGWPFSSLPVSVLVAGPHSVCSYEHETSRLLY